MKFFLTVGTQAGFDRLVQIVDEWAISKTKIEIIGQIGDYSYKPKNFQFEKYLDEKEFENHFKSADLILSHAGMGTIISACLMKKPILTLPRLKLKKEHRNDHQLKTTEGLSNAGYIHSIFTDSDFLFYLNNYSDLKTLKGINIKPDSGILDFLDSIISMD